MTATQPTILPCPFCGGEPYRHIEEEKSKNIVYDPDMFICSFICDGCDMSIGVALTADEVFAGCVELYERWNTRAEL